ncbi:hypothetical protein PQX77_013479 [Marasmius sp. AFHP31]|nr:hypothetical protein PQX77_013479 [Marasmius sp. AFHP31]
MRRRGNHLGMARLQARHSKFQRVADVVNSVSGETIKAVASHLAKEGKVSDLTDDEKRVLEFLSHVNAVSSRVPGSQAAKLFVRGEIRSYFSHFGLPQLFFTFNPSAVHSPVFQVLYGDETVDLNSRFPKVPEYNERARRLARDPDAAAQFYEFSFRVTFEHLFGWDFDKRCSKPGGGILGILKAWYGVNELTKRAMFHGHFMLWVALNTDPGRIRERMRESEEFERRFFAYFDSTIYHHLPDADVSDVVFSDYEPRTEMPPTPPSDDKDDIARWKAECIEEVKKIGEKFQRHECRQICHEYGHICDCRFLFPHDIVSASHYDRETESVRLRCLDPWVNWFNDTLLVYNRHNQDLKCILTGSGALSGMFYISDYITKMEEKRHEVLSLLGDVVTDLSKFPSKTEMSPLEQAKRTLLRCVSKLHRRKEIHAQQAARYLRGHDNAMRSHATVTMLSSVLLAKCRVMYLEGNSSARSAQFGSDDENDGIEVDPLLTFTVDDEGKVRDINQFHDYYFRGETLDHLNFYEFSRSVEREAVNAIQRPTARGLTVAIP